MNGVTFVFEIGFHTRPLTRIRSENILILACLLRPGEGVVDEDRVSKNELNRFLKEVVS